MLQDTRINFMDQTLLDQLQSAQQALDPRFRALRDAVNALKDAARLAGEAQVEALAMQKVLLKLQQASAAMAAEAQPASAAVTSETAEASSTPTAGTLETATAAFADATHKALDALAFDFARDLKVGLEARGYTVDGRPPTLEVDPLVLHLDMAGRRAQWFYGREPLTRPLPLSPTVIMKAHEQQRKAIAERTIDVPAFVGELHGAWRKLLESRSRRPAGGRVNLVETYGQLILNRQSARFWNAPSRSNFKDYERPFFVRDLVLAREAPVPVVDGQHLQLRLGTATKSQADNPGRSVWLPTGAQWGEYYADLTFDADGSSA